MQRKIDLFLRSAGNTGHITIDSDAPGLGYIVDPDDKGRLLIVSESGGGMILNRRQISAFIQEAADIMEVFA